MKITLSDGLKKQLEDEFLPPLNRLISSRLIQQPNANGAYTPEAKAIKDNHRRNILNQGRADFTDSSNGFTPEQKVDLYCYYYFQMHFTSSFMFYLKEQEFLRDLIKDKSVWFLDIGCGPFTSGLAFNCWLKKNLDLTTTEINYIGIDTSSAMLNKANQLSKSFDDLRFKETILAPDTAIFDKQLPNSEREKIILINYSYLFASHSLVVSQMLDFTRVLQLANSSPKIVILQQNPDRNDLHLKWNEYQSQLTDFFSKENYPKVYPFSFDDALGCGNRPELSFSVRCNILKSFK